MTVKNNYEKRLNSRNQSKNLIDFTVRQRLKSDDWSIKTAGKASAFRTLDTNET